MSRTPKKQPETRPKQKREPQLGQNEARTERESDSNLRHMKGARSGEQRRAEEEE